MQLIDNGLKHSSDHGAAYHGVIVASSFQPICRPSQSCAWQLTRSYFRPLSDIIITFYILNSCRHNPKRLNTTIFDNADITSLPTRTSHLADNSFVGDAKSDRCLSVLSVCPVCDVCVLWPNGLTIKMKLGMQVGLDPGHIVLDVDPTPLPQRGTPPSFRPISVAAKWLHRSRFHLVWR